MHRRLNPERCSRRWPANRAGTAASTLFAQPSPIFGRSASRTGIGIRWFGRFEAKSATLGSCPDVVVHSTLSVNADVTLREDRPGTEATPNAAGGGLPDLYTQLIKLADLREKSILTDAEFESAKGKLLNPETLTPMDIYTELLKLDDLRKRGILTVLEFETEKGKLLNPPKAPEAADGG